MIDIGVLLYFLMLRGYLVITVHSALLFFQWINNTWLALPSTFLFLLVSIMLTIKTGFLQIRGIPRLIQLLRAGVREQQHHLEGHKLDTISPVQALFTALATTLGMGNVVGPATAIVAGGPGALFWLLLYMFLGSVTKFTEVVFALHTRIRTEQGNIIGGPMEYLRLVSPYLALWYGYVMTVLFIGWSGQQANTLANIYVLEGVPRIVVGGLLAIFAWLVLRGGAKRVGIIASKLVPIMFVLYVSFSVYIIVKDFDALLGAFALIIESVFKSTAAVGGFLGATVYQAMRYGVFRGVYISESGLGTSSIPHAMSDASNPVDQGLLAMGSTIADMSLSLLSGLLVLVTGLWQSDKLSTTLVYEVFKTHAPVTGQLVLLVSVSLFVLTTIIGNSFNGLKSFSALSRDRYVTCYFFTTIACIFVGSLMPVKLVWEMMDTFLVTAAIPNLIGLLWLSWRYPSVLKLSK